MLYKKNIIKLHVGNNNSKKKKVKTIWNSRVYAKESISYLSGLYHLVFWKNYLKKENILKPYLAIQYFRKFISLLDIDYSNKPTATSKALNTIPMIAKLITKLAAKLVVKLAK